MPSNGPAENILYGLKGIPLFTYGMIGITTLVLAYVTFTDVDIEDNPLNSINPISELEKPIMDQIDQLTDKPEDSIKEEQSQQEQLKEEQSQQEEVKEQQEQVTEQQEQVTEQQSQPQEEEQAQTEPSQAELTQVKEEKLQEDQLQKQQEPPKQGGKKRTIRNRNKKRKTIRK